MRSFSAINLKPNSSSQLLSHQSNSNESLSNCHRILNEDGNRNVVSGTSTPKHRMARLEFSYIEVLEAFGGASFEEVFAKTNVIPLILDIGKGF
jgi:hypothetical protein